MNQGAQAFPPQDIQQNAQRNNPEDKKQELQNQNPNFVNQKQPSAFAKNVQWVLDKYFQVPNPEIRDQQNKMIACYRMLAVDVLVTVLEKHLPEQFQALDQQTIELIKLAFLYQRLPLATNPFHTDMVHHGYPSQAVLDIELAALTKPETLIGQLMEDVYALEFNWGNKKKAAVLYPPNLVVSAKKKLSNDAFLAFEQEFDTINQYWLALTGFLFPKDQNNDVIKYCNQQQNFLVAVLDCVHLYRIWTVFDIKPDKDHPNKHQEFYYFGFLFKCLPKIQDYIPIPPSALFDPNRPLAAHLLSSTESYVYQPGAEETVRLVCRIKKAKETDLGPSIFVYNVGGPKINFDRIKQAVHAGQVLTSVANQDNITASQQSARIAIFLNIFLMLHCGRMPKFCKKQRILSLDEVLHLAQPQEKPLLPAAVFNQLGILHEGDDHEQNYLTPSFIPMYVVNYCAADEKTSDAPPFYEVRFGNDVQFEAKVTKYRPKNQQEDLGNETIEIEGGYQHKTPENALQTAKVYTLPTPFPIRVFEKNGQRYLDSRFIGSQVVFDYFSTGYEAYQQILKRLNTFFDLTCGHAHLKVTFVSNETEVSHLHFSFIPTSYRMRPDDLLEFIGLGRLTGQHWIVPSQTPKTLSMVISNPPDISLVLQRIMALKQQVRAYLQDVQRMPLNAASALKPSIQPDSKVAHADQTKFPQSPFEKLLIALELQHNDAIDVLFGQIEHVITRPSQFNKLANALLASPRQNELLIKLLLNPKIQSLGIVWKNLFGILETALKCALQAKHTELLVFVAQKIIEHASSLNEHLSDVIDILISNNCDLSKLFTPTQLGIVLNILFHQLSLYDLNEPRKLTTAAKQKTGCRDLTALLLDEGDEDEEEAKQDPTPPSMHPKAALLLKICKAILERCEKIDIDAVRSSSKNTALRWALQCNLPKAERDELIRLFLQRHKANIHLEDAAGITIASIMKNGLATPTVTKPLPRLAAHPPQTDFQNPAVVVQNAPNTAPLGSGLFRPLQLS